MQFVYNGSSLCTKSHGCTLRYTRSNRNKKFVFVWRLEHPVVRRQHLKGVTGKEAIGEKMRQKRLELGLGVAEVARYLGTSINTVYKWESGDRFPRYHYLERILEFLNEERRDFLFPVGASSSRAIIGDRIKQKMGELGLSRKALAELMGVSYVTVYHWETGRAGPRSRFRALLNEILRVDVESLLETGS